MHFSPCTDHKQGMTGSENKQSTASRATQPDATQELTKLTSKQLAAFARNGHVGQRMLAAAHADSHPADLLHLATIDTALPVQVRLIRNPALPTLGVQHIAQTTVYPGVGRLAYDEIARRGTEAPERTAQYLAYAS